MKKSLKVKEMVYLLTRDIYEDCIWKRGEPITIHKAEYDLRWTEEEYAKEISEEPKLVKDLKHFRSKKYLGGLFVPCRANLHKLLTLLYFNGDFKTNELLVRKISENDYKYLKIIFRHQEEYRVWRKALKIFFEEGKEKVYEFIEEQMALIKLREKL